MAFYKLSPACGKACVVQKRMDRKCVSLGERGRLEWDHALNGLRLLRWKGHCWCGMAMHHFAKWFESFLSSSKMFFHMQFLQSIFLFLFVFYKSIIPSVLWRCWLGGRKGIRPVKNWVVGCWRGYLSGARCKLAYVPADATATHCLLLQ